MHTISTINQLEILKQALETQIFGLVIGADTEYFGYSVD
jgi:hypothetical protein